MVKSKDSSTKRSSEKIQNEQQLPKWAEDEIKSVNFTEDQLISRSGYILDIYVNDHKVDVQLYEALSDGRTIIEGLDVSTDLNYNDFVKGVVYEFKIQVSKAPLSQELTDLLKNTYDLEMNAIYRFELKELNLMDVESDSQGSPENEFDE
ncbi:MAG: hypothetical protein WB511_02890 [Nitrososphaeraceae archaeon]